MATKQAKKTDDKKTDDKKVLVNCADYNGHKNVVFMMRTSDFRYNDGNYTHLHDGTHSKSIFTTTDGKMFRIYPDWSAKQLTEQEQLREESLRFARSLQSTFN